jgi:hypothetical protein
LELISPLILVSQMPCSRLLITVKQTEICPYPTKSVTNLDLGVRDSSMQFSKFVKLGRDLTHEFKKFIQFHGILTEKSY